MPRVVLLWTSILLALLPAAALAESRVALVIGNGAYQNEAKLPNPARDASAIAELFKTSGFEVVRARNDLGNLDFKRALRDFFDVAYQADIAVVYYAGHAIQVGDENYMIPVDAKLAHEYDAEDEAISLERIVKAISPAKRLRLVILDACRDNPFAAKMERRVATRQIASRGLARVEPTFGDTLIAYAAKAGSTADDGDGDHSPFTTALLKHLAEPGLDVRLAFGRVRDDVLRSTRNAQEPFVYGTLGGRDITLVPAPVAPPQAAPANLNDEYQLLRKRLDELERATREKAQQEAEATRKAEEARTQKEAEAKRQAEAEEARKAAEVEATRKVEEARAQKEAEAKRQAEAEEARKAADAEAKRKADEARAQKEAEAKAKAGAEEARKAAEAEAKRKADEERAQKEADAKAKAEAEKARKAAEAEAKRKADEERARKEAEAKAKAAAEQAQKTAEAKRKTDEVRAQREAEAKAKADAEQARTAAEAEAKRKAEQEQAQKETEAKQKAEEAKVAALEPQPHTDEVSRRSTSPTSEQRTDFIMQAQRLLAACKCYSGDINGNADDIGDGLSLLVKHRQDARRIELASANVGQIEDWLAWMGSIASEKFTCPEADASKAEGSPQAKEQAPDEAPAAKRKKTTQQKPSQAARKPRAASAPARSSSPSTGGSSGPSLRGSR